MEKTRRDPFIYFTLILACASDIFGGAYLLGYSMGLYEITAPFIIFMGFTFLINFLIGAVCLSLLNSLKRV